MLSVSAKHIDLFEIGSYSMPVYLSLILAIALGLALSCAIGFGISTPEHIGEYVKSMKDAIR